MLLIRTPRSRLRSEISKLPQKPTDKQQLMIARMRARLAKKVKDFLQASNSYLPTLEEADLRDFEDETIDSPVKESVEPEESVDESLDEDFNYEDEEESEAPSVPPESIVLPLPSNIISIKVKSSLESLISVERELRKAKQMMLWRVSESV